MCHPKGMVLREGRSFKTAIPKPFWLKATARDLRQSQSSAVVELIELRGSLQMKR